MPMFWACGSDKDTVVFGDAGWDSMKFHNAVAEYIAETAYNLKTSEISGTTAVTYTGLKRGDIDVYMETWTDSIADYDDDIAAGTIKELSLNYGDNSQGFYIPKYVQDENPGLKTVADLAKYSSLFPNPNGEGKGVIYGVPSGWEVSKVMENKFYYYGLDSYYDYVDPGSDATLQAEIASAYSKHEAIVAYYWDPTWITGQYELVLLEDAPYDSSIYEDGKCACPSMRVTVSVNSDFYAKNPEFCAFLEKYKTSSALTAEALSYIEKNDATYSDTAKWFLKQHSDLIDEWLPSDKADIIKSDLGLA
jgi:glycine betaine/proline transport system permease protein/glycine betaine/proline transport system substrate-binding protein